MPDTGISSSGMLGGTGALNNRSEVVGSIISGVGVATGMPFDDAGDGVGEEVLCTDGDGEAEADCVGRGLPSSPLLVSTDCTTHPELNANSKAANANRAIRRLSITLLSINADGVEL